MAPPTDNKVPVIRWVLAFDVGGTFTDLVLDDLLAGRRRTAKVLTTPEDFSIGIARGIVEILGNQIDELKAGDVVIRGATTLVTNAIIERRGAKTAFVTTSGFRDLLMFARESRYDMYDLQIDLPMPLVPIELCYEVPERIGPAGQILRPLELEALDAIVADFGRQSVQSVGVSLLHSYANPAHELAVRDALSTRMPGLAITLSSELAPEVREYERASTTVANAFVQPLIRHHVGQLRAMLRDLGHRGELYLMLSEGGIVAAEDAETFPIRLVESGPAAGALASGRLASEIEEALALSFDMGGTTAKACLIRDGAPTVTREIEVARLEKFKPGSGLPLKVPSVHLIEIGAGGGSVARIDRLGLLKVGPHSAGAEPGPACYGRGGREATVTDANLILGYLGEESFLGGAMKLDRSAAERAVGRIAAELGTTLIDVARGIFDVVTENMAAAARTHVAELGDDVSRCTLVAFGGAGPVHAHELIRRLGIRRCIVPSEAGVNSAAGLSIAPAAIDVARTYVGRVDSIEWDSVSEIFDDLEHQATTIAKAANATSDELVVQRWADMRYVGQGFEVLVPVAGGKLGAAAQSMAGDFAAVYERLFGHSPPGFAAEVLTWRVRVEGPWLAGAGLPNGSRRGDARRSYRPVFVAGTGVVAKVPVYDRYRLSPGDVVLGPAVIEERETTTVVGDAQRCSVDEARRLVLEEL